MPVEELLNITQKNVFNSFSGMSKNIIPAAWSLGLKVGSGELQVQQLSTAWMSALAVVGDVVEQQKAAVCLVCVAGAQTQF